MSEKPAWIGMRGEAHRRLCLPTEVYWLLMPELAPN